MKPNRPVSGRKAAVAQQSLFDAISQIDTVEEARDFLNDLCTPAELQALTDRWMVVEPLMEGCSYRNIAEKTGVSVTTVGRVARFLTQGNGGYKRIFDRINAANRTL